LQKFIEKAENNYNFYRQIVFDSINLNKEIMKVFFPECNEETETKFNQRYIIYILPTLRMAKIIQWMLKYQRLHLF
jgi:hypothetical protein